MNLLGAHQQPTFEHVHDHHRSFPFPFHRLQRFWFTISAPAQWRICLQLIAMASTFGEQPGSLVAVAPADVVSAPKRCGRPRKGNRPKIDIDDEIQEANRLAEVSRKMMQAAKSAQRNSRRSKQRLVRKAGKLSAADLERIATLKRCGLFVPQVPEGPEAETTSFGVTSASRGMAPGLPARRVNDKLLAVVGQVEGAAHLLASMHSWLPVSGDMSPRPQSSASIRLPSNAHIVSVPRGNSPLTWARSCSPSSGW